MLQLESSKEETALAVGRTVVESVPTFGLILPMSVFTKGEEKRYELTTVYINEPITLEAGTTANQSIYSREETTR